MLEQSWEKYFQEQQPIQFHFTTRKWLLSTEWTRTWPSIGIRMKKWLWFWFVWIVEIVFQGAWVLYRINKYKGDESLLLLAFWRHDNSNFFEIFKGTKIILEPFKNSKYAIRCCYDDTKHYQVQSEHRLIQNHFKHLRGSVFA